MASEPPSPPPPPPPKSPPSSPCLFPCFPRAAGSGAQGLRKSRRLPVRPRKIGPVFSAGLSRTPIAEFDTHRHAINYAPAPDGGVARGQPPQPSEFADPYLMPTLNEKERLRLTMFWYYTRDILQDDEFLQRLQDKLDLVQTLIGWEFAIVGLLSEDVFTRLATSGLPLAILPRRESTCSHTINQPPGTVFMLPDMESDWRFKGSPHVVHGGLRSYAGTQLRCKAPNGEEVALGSLCVASNTKQPVLSDTQQSILLRFADVIVSELVSHSREARKRQRCFMAQRLAECQPDGTSDFETKVLAMIQQIYPDSSVQVQEASYGMIPLPEHSPIHIDHVEDGLWEDVAAIQSLIQTRNYAKLEASETIRAIVQPCHTYLATTYLVVASNQAQRVFDDVDAWFIESCGRILSHANQEDRLKEALKAKEKFLRGITHQLRTPIHGVLGSCELLAEELKSLDILSEACETAGTPQTPRTVLALNTIRDSGRELMSTINNILKMNIWADSVRSRGPARLRALNQIEVDIMYDVHQLLPEHEFAKVSVLFENRLPEGTIEMDVALLKECIQALIVNALTYTDEGAVITVISAPPDYSRLIFDVYDTGCGIAPSDQQRIFDAYEKVNPHTRGVGLGLTLASKIATAMDGSVSLVMSSQEHGSHGSHFRAEFRSPHFAFPLMEPKSLKALLTYIPSAFHVLPCGGKRQDLVRHVASYLTYHGFHDSDQLDNAMILLTYSPDSNEFLKLVNEVQPGQVAICLVPAGAKTSTHRGKHDVMFFKGPFLSARLETMLKEIDGRCRHLYTEKLCGGTIPLGTPEEVFKTWDVVQTGPPKDVEPVALLVDDNAVNLRIFRMYCEKRSIPYSTAVDGLEAVDQYKAALEKSEPVNIILMDLQMPVCDGLDATRTIREIERERSLEPSCIFMVTGQDSALDRTRSFEAGADEFYVKPMGIKTLDRSLGGRFPALMARIAPPKKKKALGTCSNSQSPGVVNND